MSIKRRLTAQSQVVLRFFHALTLPSWMTGGAMRVALLSILVVSSGAYILETSSSVALGYQIKSLETSIAELNYEQQKMAVEVATYRSMASVESRLADLNMVPVARINRVTAPTAGGDVAIAKK